MHYLLSHARPVIIWPTPLPHRQQRRVRMSVYLSYWKPARVDWENPGAKVLNHAASQQYDKVKSGDRVYLLTARNGKVYLLGAITVDAVLNQVDAAARLGRKPEELWQSDYHIIARNGTAKPLQLIR